MCWQTGRPPNETIVEVECDGKIIEVMAYHGRDGTLPHWKTADGSRVWSVPCFPRWRVPEAPREQF